MKIFLALIAFALAALGLGFLLNTPVISSAGATEFYDPFSYHSTARRKVVYRKKARKHRDEDRRYFNDPDWRFDRDPEGARCLREPVKVISTEHTSKENALDAAKKMWAFNVQWEKGSRFMSLDLATDYAEYCGQSNAMDTASGRINEAVNSALGKDGVNMRCVIRARPCRAILEQAEGHR